MIPTPTPIRHSDIDWSKGICAQGKFDPDTWSNDETEDLAVSICRAGEMGGMPCQIIVKCLQYALESKQKFGVWGGLTADQRKVTGWAKKRVKCPGCRSINVEKRREHTETCLACGLSWSI